MEENQAPAPAKKSQRRDNPGKHLAGLQQNSLIRGKDNLDLILTWIYKWGWTYSEIIKDLLQIKRSIEYDYIKKGALKQIDLGPGFRKVYIIGTAYLEYAKELHDNLRLLCNDENINDCTLKYDYNKGNISTITQNHTFYAQKVAVREFLQTNNYSISEINNIVISERELFTLAKMQKDARPDFIMFSKIYYEIELSAKYNEQLYFQLKNKNQALKDRKAIIIKFYCLTNGILNNIEKALNQEDGKIIDVIRAPNKKIVFNGQNGGRWNAENLKNKIKLYNLKDYLNGDYDNDDEFDI